MIRRIKSFEIGYTLPIRKHRRKVLSKAKKIIRTAIISHVDNNESRFFKSSKIDNVKTRTISYITNLKYCSSSNKLMNITKIIDPESSILLMTKYQFQMISTKTIILIKVH